MRFAIAAEGNQVATHFGRCEYYEVTHIANERVEKRYRLESTGHAPVGELPKLLHGEGVDCVVAGGMGPMAQQFFAQIGIQTILGVSGLLEDVISKVAAGTLVDGDDECVHSS